MMLAWATAMLCVILLALGWAATQPTGALHAYRVAVAEARR
jgi:hypothetical protein